MIKTRVISLKGPLDSESSLLFKCIYTSPLTIQLSVMFIINILDQFTSVGMHTIKTKSSCKVLESCLFKKKKKKTHHFISIVLLALKECRLKKV